MCEPVSQRECLPEGQRAVDDTPRMPRGVSKSLLALQRAVHGAEIPLPKNI